MNHIFKKERISRAHVLCIFTLTLFISTNGAQAAAKRAAKTAAQATTSIMQGAQKAATYLHTKVRAAQQAHTKETLDEHLNKLVESIAENNFTPEVINHLQKGAIQSYQAHLNSNTQTLEYFITYNNIPILNDLNILKAYKALLDNFRSLFIHLGVMSQDTKQLVQSTPLAQRLLDQIAADTIEDRYNPYINTIIDLVNNITQSLEIVIPQFLQHSPTAKNCNRYKFELFNQKTDTTQLFQELTQKIIYSAELFCSLNQFFNRKALERNTNIVNVLKHIMTDTTVTNNNVITKKNAPIVTLMKIFALIAHENNRTRGQFLTDTTSNTYDPTRHQEAIKNSREIQQALGYIYKFSDNIIKSWEHSNKNINTYHLYFIAESLNILFNSQNKHFCNNIRKFGQKIVGILIECDPLTALPPVDTQNTVPLYIWWNNNQQKINQFFTNITNNLSNVVEQYEQTKQTPLCRKKQ